MTCNFVFDCSELVTMMKTYWQLDFGDLDKVKDAIWDIAKRCDWDLWYKPVDVMLLEASREVCYEDIRAAFLSKTADYDMSSIFKDIVQKQKQL